MSIGGKGGKRDEEAMIIKWGFLRAEEPRGDPGCSLRFPRAETQLSTWGLLRFEAI